MGALIRIILPPLAQTNMNSFILVFFIVILSVTNAGLIRQAIEAPVAGETVIRGPSTRTEIIGPDGSHIVGVAPGGVISTVVDVGYAGGVVNPTAFSHSAPALLTQAEGVVHDLPAGITQHVLAHSSPAKLQALPFKHFVAFGEQKTIVSTGLNQVHPSPLVTYTNVSPYVGNFNPSLLTSGVNAPSYVPQQGVLVANSPPQPAPAGFEHPPQTVFAQSSPTVFEQPAPTTYSQPAPAVIPQPSPTVIPQPSPAVVTPQEVTTTQPLFKSAEPNDVQFTPTVASTPAPSIISQPEPSVVPQSSVTIIPQSGPTELPQTSPTAIPQPPPTIAPQSVTVIPQSSQTVAPPSLVTILPKSAPTVIPQPSPTILPQSSPTVPPQPSPTILPQSHSTIPAQPSPAALPRFSPVFSPSSINGFPQPSRGIIMQEVIPASIIHKPAASNPARLYNINPNFVAHGAHSSYVAPGSGIGGQYVPDNKEKYYDDGSYKGEFYHHFYH